jgi:opacity protein-like surface antigen
MIFGAGLNYKITPHLAVRVEYRGFFYKKPDFAYYSGNAVPISKLFTVTNEPAVSLVYTFGGNKRDKGTRRTVCSSDLVCPLP